MQSFENPAVVTLTTDFGLTDHYVGSMKAVILSRCRSAQIVDITHGIEPFSILAGAYAIAQAAPYFPEGTVHVVVIDPGVGTERKGLAAAAGGQVFIAPDNGVLGLLLARYPAAMLRELANRELWLPDTSATFHGRDIFSAVAGALVSGQAQFEDVGPMVESLVELDRLKPVEVSRGLWRGRVLSIDHFGNVITNLSAARFPSVAASTFSIRLKEMKIVHFRRTFGAAGIGEPFAYFGSSGFIELALNQQSLAAEYKIKAADDLMLELGS